MVLRILFYSTMTIDSTDENPTSQWKFDKRPPHPIQEVANKFCDKMKKFHYETVSEQKKNTRSNIPLPSFLSPLFIPRNIL